MSQRDDIVAVLVFILKNILKNMFMLQNRTKMEQSGSSQINSYLISTRLHISAAHTYHQTSQKSLIMSISISSMNWNLIQKDMKKRENVSSQTNLIPDHLMYPMYKKQTCILTFTANCQTFVNTNPRVSKYLMNDSYGKLFINLIIRINIPTILVQKYIQPKKFCKKMKIQNITTNRL